MTRLVPTPPPTIDLGGLVLTVLDGGSLRLDGATLYGIQPRVFWERVNRPDEDNRVLLALAPLLVATAEGYVVIDPGIGAGWNAAARDRYDLRGTRDLDDLLRSVGIPVDDVIGVVATHLHFDHVAAAVRRLSEDREEGASPEWLHRSATDLEPVLPRARLAVQQRELEAALSPELRTAPYLASGLPEVYRRAGRLLPLEGKGEPFPGIKVECTGGHTQGHQVVWIEGRDATLLVAGDLIPTTSHLRAEVLEGVDVEPLATARAKAELLSRVVARGAFLSFYHAPRVRWARVRPGPAGGYRLEETATASPATGPGRGASSLDHSAEDVS